MEGQKENGITTPATPAKLIAEFLTENTPLDMIPHSDAIFVFGHYESNVAKHVAAVWAQGKADYMIISGKGRDKIPVGFETEADFYSSLVTSFGVPKDAQVLELLATNSKENVQFGIEAAHKRGLYPKSLILCGMPPLFRRCCATFHKQFPDITVNGSSFPIPIEWYTPRRLARLIGEIERLGDYAVKGDIVPVEIPENVLAAVKELRQSLNNPDLAY